MDVCYSGAADGARLAEVKEARRRELETDATVGRYMKVRDNGVDLSFRKGVG